MSYKNREQDANRSHSKLSFLSLSFSSSFVFNHMGFVRQEKGQSITLTVNTGNLLELPNNNQSSVVASNKVSSVSPAVKAGLPIFSYCIASIVMTVTNKYVVSGDFNMVFLLLTVQVNDVKKKRKGANTNMSEYRHYFVSSSI